MRRAYAVQVYATVYVDDEDPSAPFEVEVGPDIDPDFLVDDPEEDWTAEDDDAWHYFCYWLSQGVKPIWRFGTGTRTSARIERHGRSWCGYCGFEPCRSTARTADGHDLRLFAKHHPGSAT